MSTLDRFNGLATRFCAFSLTLVCLAGFSSVAKAQTAPQLLPYIPKILAGGGAAIANGALCPDTSGNRATDSSGDGCLATSILFPLPTPPSTTQISSPRYAVADSAGNVFFSDYAAGLIRRIDAVTGVVTAVAGGPFNSPAAAAACGTSPTPVSLDAKGDGCLGTQVNLFQPSDLKFAANGDLYFIENGNQDVRKITAVNGLITTTGVISLVVGNVAKTSGYAVNQGATLITTGPGSTKSLLDFPASLAFDTAGNLYIADEGNQALEVVNLTSATETIQGVTVPAGTIAKLAGEGNAQTKATTGECPNAPFVSSSNRGGCAFGTYVSGNPAVTSNLDSPYAVALDSANNVYFDNEFLEEVGKISSGTISTFAGNGSNTTYTASKPFPRGPAGSFSIGGSFGLIFDNKDNAYITDAFDGVIWRVDKSGTMYVVAGGSFTTPVANTPCPGASTYISTDAYGDGCPATSAIFGKSGSSFASTTSPGIYGVSVDAYSNLFVGDSVLNLIREVATGTVLGTKGTSTVIVHYVAGDSPAKSNAYVITSGAFTATPGNCVPNTDGTQDCPVVIGQAGTVLGLYTGTLKITSTNGGSATYPISAIYAPTPVTSTTVTASTGATCVGSPTFLTGTPVTLNAIITASANPTGTVQFFANGIAVGAPQPITGGQSSYVFTPTTVNTFRFSATYIPDAYFTGSTGTATATITTAAPTFTAQAATAPLTPVVAGQTALYSFTINETAYTGTLTFACSGLPAGTQCIFSPATLPATGCSSISGQFPTVALSIQTTQAGPLTASFGTSGRGSWQAFGILPGLLLALWVGVRRRKSRFNQVWLALALLIVVTGLTACGKSGNTILPTPSGSTPVTVTVTGSAGTVSSFPIQLVVK